LLLRKFQAATAAAENHTDSAPLIHGQRFRIELCVCERLPRSHRYRVTDLGAVEIEFVAQLFGQRGQSKPRRSNYAVWGSIWRIHSR